MKLILIPYIVSGLGILADWITTQIGLNQGYSELHPNYSPFNAILIFWGALIFLDLLPGKEHKTRIWEISKILFSSMAWIGPLYNILVLWGIFPGF